MFHKQQHSAISNEIKCHSVHFFLPVAVYRDITFFLLKRLAQSIPVAFASSPPSSSTSSYPLPSLSFIRYPEATTVPSIISDHCNCKITSSKIDTQENLLRLSNDKSITIENQSSTSSTRTTTSQRVLYYNLVNIKKTAASSLLLLPLSRKQIIRLILIAMVSLTILGADLHPNHHSSSSLTSRIFVNAESSVFDESSHKQVNDNVKHSRNANESPLSPSSSSKFDSEQLRHVERQFLRIMGIPTRPNPAKHHKVPEYLIDLYRWFKENNDGSAHYKQEDELDDHQDNENVVDQMQSNSLMGLTTEDLYDIQNSFPHHQNDYEHHRLIRRRRSTQLSRVTLQGPSTTVISHKTSSLSSHLTKPISKGIDPKNVKPKSSSDNDNRNTDPEYSSRQQTHITHLKFNIQLPSDETLTGAELRLYRHSIHENESSSTKEPRIIDNDLTRKNLLSSHNNFWPSAYQSSKVLKSATFENSHPIISRVNNSLFSSPSSNSGEEYSTRSTSSDVNNDDHYLQRVNIYHLLRPLSRDEQQQQQMASETLFKRSKLIDTQVIDVRDSGWLSFDVYPAVEWWLKHPTENYGLLITIKNHNGLYESSHSNLFVFNSTITNSGQVQSATSHQQQQLKIDDNHEWHELQPLIITFSNDARTHQHYLMSREKLLNRSKRDRKRGGSGGMRNGQSKNYSQQRPKKKSHKNSSKQRNNCRRYHMFFDFKDVGWMDWIVAPPGYQAFYCKGECSYPMSQQMNKTNHAIIQSLINSVNPAVVPEPCCIPTDLSSVTLLYLDHHEKVVLKSYPNMIVEGCGCS
ncbi:Bone morphogenetic protein 2 [Dermatophagoides pteronyssinus]|uniref:Bone morphogenetic protein 2 n=1 Tax=Dermatophagoides pteronyssinus TaxID=6956 RepID=A0ABQ8JA89_DERPT|nr:Bone morphogenetic protein 2 [Dermatophagoides pteronyssinus]